MKKMVANDYILPLQELRMKDVGIVGGKNASLGEMISNLSEANVNVPGGYATTAKAFWDFLDHNQLRERIKLRLKELNVDDVKQLISVGKEIRQWIVESPFQTRLKKSIKDHGGKISN